jgi:hypothetical protein
MIEKEISKIKFKSFKKNKTNLGLRNKNMHIMECNPIKLMKISYCYLSEMH